MKKKKLWTHCSQLWSKVQDLTVICSPCWLSLSLQILNSGDHVFSNMSHLMVYSPASSPSLPPKTPHILVTSAHPASPTVTTHTVVPTTATACTHVQSPHAQAVQPAQPVQASDSLASESQSGTAPHQQHMVDPFQKPTCPASSSTLSPQPTPSTSIPGAHHRVAASAQRVFVAPGPSTNTTVHVYAPALQPQTTPGTVSPSSVPPPTTQSPPGV